jgi:hypothetical protein
LTTTTTTTSIPLPLLSILRQQQKSSQLLFSTKMDNKNNKTNEAQLAATAVPTEVTIFDKIVAKQIPATIIVSITIKSNKYSN